MDARTAKLWAAHDRHVGDRQRLFETVSRSIDANKVLYPGCYVDIAPSMVFDDVTYVDNDKRFPKFFDDEEGVREIIDAQRDTTFTLGETEVEGGLSLVSYRLPRGVARWFRLKLELR